MPPSRGSQTLLTNRSTPYTANDSQTSRYAESDTDASSLLFRDSTPESASTPTKRAASGRATRERKPKERITLPSVTIDRHVLKPTLAFDAFWKWIAERKAIDDKRRRGEPAPWTEDTILQKWYFCNSYRVLDKVCQFLITDVIEKGPQDPVETVFRVLLFFSFNKIQTWQELERRLRPLRWSTYDRKTYEDALADMKAEKGRTLYTGAYIKGAPSFGFSDNFRNHLRLLESMMENEMPMKLLNAPTLADVFEYIVSFPSMGDFLSYQLLLNLSYTNVLNFHPNDFVMLGPGSISGLVKLFGKSFEDVFDADNDFGVTVLRWLVDNQDEQFKRLGLEFTGLGPERLKLDLSDIEHAVCEVDKYCRRKYPQIKGRKHRTNMKRAYCVSGGSTLPKVPALPKAWAHPDRKTLRIREGEIHREQRYEIRKIGDHCLSEEDEGWTGEREFLVFWEGYPDSAAEWLPERSLMEDAPVIVQEYLTSIGKGVKTVSMKPKKGKGKGKAKGR